MRVHAGVCALAILLCAEFDAFAQVELKNDGFVSGGMAFAEGGFAVGDIGASRYVAPAAGRQLLKMQLLFGGATAMRTITFKVWDDSAGTNNPGTELFAMDFQITGSDSALQELDVSAGNVIVPQQFRAGLVFQDNTPGGTRYPSMMRDNDGVMADKNYIYDPTIGWRRSSDP